MYSPRKSFLQQKAEVTAAASRTPVGQVMLPLGFTVAHTGGNNWAWEYRLPGTAFIWVTDDNLDLGESVSEDYVVALYRNDDDQMPVYTECKNIREALDAVFTARCAL